MMSSGPELPASGGNQLGKLRQPAGVLRLTFSLWLSFWFLITLQTFLYSGINNSNQDLPCNYSQECKVSILGVFAILFPLCHQVIWGASLDEGL